MSGPVFAIRKECKSCGNVFKFTEVDEQVFDEAVADDPDADVSVENGTSILNYTGCCKPCEEDYYADNG